MAGLEGRVLDRYELRRLVGRGGMADVYLGFDEKFQRDIAVKVFKREDEDLLRRFLREARLMASLHNSHLMPVFDTGVDDIDGIPYYYIVMPFMGDGTLRGKIRQGPLPFDEVCRYMQEIADGLDYLHSKGIIHRDIKASNVLLDSDDKCYLSDFGIARTDTDATQLTSTGNVLGTVDYVAPELFEPDHKADAGSDLYSLAVLLFEMVTGRLPFAAENQIALVTMHMTKQPPRPSQIVPGIPPQMEQVILRGLAKNPQARFRSASEFANAFCATINDAQAGNGSSYTWQYEDEDARSERNDAPLILPGAESVAPIVPIVPIAPNAPIAPQPLPSQPLSSRKTTRVIQEPAYGYPPRQPPQAFQPSRSGSRSGERSRGRILIVIALIFVIAVLGPAVYILLGNTPSSTKGTSGAHGTPTATQRSTTTPQGETPTATPNLTATAQVYANATQQAKQATATAIAGVTVTAQVRASATVGVIQTATAGTPSYQDALNNENSPTTMQEQWDDNDNCVFKSDGYHVIEGTSLLNDGQLKGCMEQGTRYSDFTFSIDMTIVSGHSGGIFFRVNTKTLGAYAGYLFEVDNTGRYKISKSSNFSTGTGNETIQDWATSSALKVSAKNTLEGIANSNSFSFYANGSYLTTVQDSDNTFTDGYIALLATTVTGGEDADILYSNISVYEHS